MNANARHAAASTLVVCALFAARPRVALAQADSSFGGGWENVGLDAGPAWSSHDSYASAGTLGLRIGGTFRVASHLAVRVDAHGMKAFGGGSRCTDVAYGVGASCAPGLGALWGGTVGIGYLVADATGVPQTFVSVAPGVLNISGAWNGTGSTGCGLRASLEHVLSKSQSGALTIGVGVLAVLNVHHDTILEIPMELGGWSW